MMTSLSFLKLAGTHAEIRGKERLELSPEATQHIQKLTDAMWYSHGRKKLTGDMYYSPLRNSTDHGISGYAAFRKVGNPGRNRLILTTILSKEMKPKGNNIGSFFNADIPGIYPKSSVEPKKFEGMPPIPDAKRSH